MKAELEVEETEYRGVILESETPEEAEVLKRLWTGDGRVVVVTRVGEQLTLTVAPIPRGEVAAQLAPVAL